MEYSVNDLVRILLRKWYVIILSMCLLGAVSIFTSHSSYESVKEEYDTVMAAPEAEMIGTLSVSFSYDCVPMDPGDYTAGGQDVDASVLESVKSLLLDARVLDAIGAEEDLSSNGKVCYVIGHNLFEAELLAPGLCRIRMAGMEKSRMEQITSVYCQTLQEVAAQDYRLKITLEQNSAQFDSDITTGSGLAQTLMLPPEKPGATVRIVGTAMAFGFLLSCFGVLLYTFVRDSRRGASEKNENK